MNFISILKFRIFKYIGAATAVLFKPEAQTMNNQISAINIR